MSARSQLHRGGQRMRQARRAVIDRDGNICRRCSRPIDLTLSGLSSEGLNLGHIVPASQGGTDDLSNLGAEHRRCNLAAGSRRDPPRAAIALPINVADVIHDARRPNTGRPRRLVA